jgi:hypothetical protein
MGGSIMIVKKNITKYSIEYTLIQGNKVFKFQEYTDDFWADRKIYPNDKKPMFLKGHTHFSEMGQNIGFATMWFPITKKNITNIKDAKRFVRNREYL